MKSICKTFSEMSVIFRDESNDSMICYSDATYSNHPLNAQAKASLDSSGSLARGSEVEFVN